MTEEIFPQGHLWTAQLWQLRAALHLARNDAVRALQVCDEATALLVRLEQQRGTIAESVSVQRASALRALGRLPDALAETERALAMWQGLAPAGDLHRIELLDGLASLQAGLGDVPGARDAARRALALVEDRRQIEPALLARIDAMAARAR
jgi:eukaryotic-like serine/threonine-protein kinase